ncbi:hypothetical protein J2128_001053 [Methanomicrobium sp. W14]|uniref:type IV pilin n=1 Tax=Methanomicrobium sp. W14 TaxID=2817839 RepID=UPI001AE13162|nr:type IV pilin [Methanomicrobium sp. W14]MBP2133132.1 hypothetical protein [Methanomicrobium sp. W14]
MVDIHEREGAVSPVVGVMLMLVVTIILAAVVSAFGTGMMGDTTSSMPATVKYIGINPGGDDKKLDNGFVGLIFEVTGGSLDLEKMKFYISGTGFGGGGEAFMTYNDALWGKYYNGGDGASGGNRFYFNNPGTGMLAYDPTEFYTCRMMKFKNLDPTGEGMCPEETILSTGDRFILFIEYLSPQSATAPAKLGFGVHRSDGSGASTAFQSGAVSVNGDGHGILSSEDGTVFWDGYMKASDIL